MRTEIVLGMDEKEYRAHPGVSVSEIKTLLGGIPAEARAYREQKKEPTPAMIFGTLCHLAVLEPARFKGSHHIRPETYPATKSNKQVKAGRIAEGDPIPWNGNASFCEEWDDLHADKPVLKALGDLSRDSIDAVVASIAAMPEAARILAWRGNNEVNIFAEHEPTGLQIKGRCDRLSEDDDGRPVIVDLKTTADPAAFERTAAAMHYHLQDAFYTMLMQAHGSDPLFAFIAAGTSAPYAVRAGVLDKDAKRKGAEEVGRLLGLYARCMASGDWPAYKVDDMGLRTGMETFTLPRWIHLEPVTP